MTSPANRWLASALSLAIPRLACLAIASSPLIAQDPEEALVRQRDEDARAMAGVINRLGVGLLMGGVELPENYCSCPVPAEMALLLVGAGAPVNVRSEIAGLAHPKGWDWDRAAEGVRRLIANIGRRGDVGCRVVNCVCLREGLTVDPAYAKIVSKGLGASVEVLKEASEPESTGSNGCRQVLTDVVGAEAGDGMWRHVVDKRAWVVVVSGLQLKVDWKAKFARGNSCVSGFGVDEKRVVQSTFMNGLLNAEYADDRGCKWLRLEMGGGELVFDIILPEGFASKEDLRELMVKLCKEDGDGLARLQGRLARSLVDVSIPCFRVVATEDVLPYLDRALRPKGVVEPRLPDGCLGTIRREEVKPEWRLVMARSLTALEINEDGLGLAAACLVGAGVGVDERPWPTFRADRPFVFLLRDRGTGLVLASGWVRVPAIPGGLRR